MSLKSLLSNYYGGARGDNVGSLVPYRAWRTATKGTNRVWADEKEEWTRNYNAANNPQPVMIPRPVKAKAARRHKRPKKKDFVLSLMLEGVTDKKSINKQWKALYPPKPRKPREDLENYKAYQLHKQTNCIIKNDPHVILAQRNLKAAIDVAKERKQSEACRKYNKAENWIVNAVNPDDPFGLELD